MRVRTDVFTRSMEELSVSHTHIQTQTINLPLLGHFFKSSDGDDFTAQGFHGDKSTITFSITLHLFSFISCPNQNIFRSNQRVGVRAFLETLINDTDVVVTD